MWNYMCIRWLINWSDSTKMHGATIRTVPIYKMCLFTFSTNFVWNLSRSNKNAAKYYHNCTEVYVQSTCYSCHILMKLVFCRQIFEKHSYSKVQETKSGGSRVVAWGRADRLTDRNDDAKNLFSQFYESAYKCYIRHSPASGVCVIHMDISTLVLRRHQHKLIL